MSDLVAIVPLKSLMTFTKEAGLKTHPAGVEVSLASADAEDFVKRGSAKMATTERPVQSAPVKTPVTKGVQPARQGGDK